MTDKRIQVTPAGLLVAAVTAGVVSTAVVFVVLPGIESSARNACINNLRQIDGAQNSYALEYGGMATTILSHSSLAIYIKDTNLCFCPLAKGANRTIVNSYAVKALTSPPTCRIAHSDLNHRLDFVAR